MPDETAVMFPALDYISEDDLNTYEGWLKYQAIDLSALTEEEAVDVREIFDDAVKATMTARKVGRMKLKARPGEFKYAVAIRDGGDLWLGLWVKRTAKPEYFILHPTADGDWNPHSSLHTNGTFHMKSHGRVMLSQQKQRPDSIEGTEHIGVYGGYGPKAVGAVCDPADFTGVFEAPAGILGPRNGQVAIDLIEAGSGRQPLYQPAEEVARHLFTDSPTHMLIRVFRS
jgi:hypothetical protein